MKSMIRKLRSAFPRRQEQLPEQQPEERLQVLVGRQKAIVRGRGSVNGSEGLVRDAS